MVKLGQLFMVIMFWMGVSSMIWLSNRYNIIFINNWWDSRYKLKINSRGGNL